MSMMGLGAIELSKRQPLRERLDPSYAITTSITLRAEGS
jgi:hypothetical protein